jgi:predicted Zn-dependent protease
MARRRLVMGAAALLVLGCATLDPNSRLPYDYSIPLTPGLTFHWPSSSLPVRIWVQSSGDLDHAIDNAIAEWESNAPYGEFRAVTTGNAATADVIVRTGTVHAASDLYPDRACDSQTSWAVNVPDSTLVLPFRTIITAHTGFAAADIAKCFEILGVHELGHIVGIIGNSDNPDDVMYGLPTNPHLSAGDRATFMELYHRTPSVRLPASRQ